MIWRIALCATLLWTGPVVAQTGPPDRQAYDRLSWPVDCALGQGCFIQNYLDRDPGDEIRDIGCGLLTYDGHKGTDIALASLTALRRGVTVRAAAPGRVQAVRDSMPDTLQTDANAPDVAGRECGNGVAIRQNDGVLALYCHMKRGSLVVKDGAEVESGDPLGEIGLSGNTTFPHLHFELLDGDMPIDPFAPARAHSSCQPESPLWAETVPYVPAGLIAVGLTARIPQYDNVKSGLATPETLTDPPRLLAWGYGFGARSGDVLAIRIDGPDGVLLDETAIKDRPRAQFYQYIGRPRGPEGWTAGLYRAEITLRREGQVLDQRAAETRID